MNVFLLLMNCLQNKDSALHKAAQKGHRDVVELLVERKANMYLRNEVLYYLCQSIHTVLFHNYLLD